MTKNTFTLRVSDSFSFFVMLIFSIFAVFTILSIFSGPKSVLGAETEKNMEPTQLLTQEESQAAYETLIDLLRNPGPCYSSKTHLFYSVPIEKLPSLARFRDMDPNPVGYGSGADDCTLYGGTLLFGLVELYDLTHDDALRPLVYDAWLGMRNVGSAHHIWGFVSRGLHPDDKTATYATSSRDQYTHYAESLWRFYRSPLCDEETRGEIRELLAVLADSLMEEITQENDFSILRADGMHDPRGLHKMWNVYAHESARLPMIYAAAWEVTGDDKYYQECQKYLDVALEDSLSLPTRPRSEVNGWVPTYSFYQMQCSLELLEAVIPEADPKGKIQKEKIRQAIQQTAEFASIRIPGLVNRKAGRREFAEILIAQTILPTLAMTDETRTHLRSILLENGMRTTYPGQTVHLVRAYANACKNGSVPLPKTVGKTENSVNETTESAQENMLAAEKEPFAWVHKPAMGRINPNLVVFCEHKGGEEGQLEAQKISTMYPQPAKIVMWNTGRGPVEISLKAENPDTEIYYIQGGMTEKIVEMPRADLILTDTLTAEQVERWRKTEKRTKPFFVLLASAPTVKDTELWETLKLESAAFQGVLWGDGPEPYELKLNEMLKKTCFKIPLTFAYLQLDRWEFALRPISLMPGDLKARMARIYRMTPELVATFPES
ncbi:MAG: hypothetical protein Q4C70_13455, partial [Planctomycetia bacterium]|nr:hypothetical protein [Planctomycetia bacterium]